MFGITREPKFITIIRGAVVGLLAVIIIVIGLIDTIKIMQPAIDLNDPDLDWNTLKAGQHVEMDVDFIMGQYMYTTDNGSEIDRDYLMGHLAYDEETDLYTIDGIVGLKLGKESSRDFSAADLIIENCVRWWLDDSGRVPMNTITIHVDGFLQNMNADQKGFAKEYMDKQQFSEEAQAKFFHPLYICKNASAGPVLLGVGIVMELLSGGLLFYAIKIKQY